MEKAWLAPVPDGTAVCSASGGRKVGRPDSARECGRPKRASAAEFFTPSTGSFPAGAFVGLVSAVDNISTIQMMTGRLSILGGLNASLARRLTCVPFYLPGQRS